MPLKRMSFRTKEEHGFFSSPTVLGSFNYHSALVQQPIQQDGIQITCRAGLCASLFIPVAAHLPGLPFFGSEGFLLSDLANLVLLAFLLFMSLFSLPAWPVNGG